MLQFRKKIEGAISKAPFVFITIPILCGIIASSHLPNPHLNSVCITLIILTTVCFTLYSCNKPLQLPAYGLWFLVFGFFLTVIHDSSYLPIIGNQTITAEITNALEEKNKTYKTEITVYTAKNKKSKAIVYIHKDSLSQMLRYGDILTVTADFKPIENNASSTFDYKAFNANRYIFSSAYIAGRQWEKIGHTQSLQSISNYLQNKLLHILRTSTLHEKNFELLAALVFGNKSFLQNDTKQEFSTAGAMHILAVSGLHVGIIAVILLQLLRLLPSRKNLWFTSIFCILGIWGYACITGLSPSVTRAACMFSLLSIAQILNRKTSTYNTLAAAACIMVIIEPRVLFEIGFQLSYAAVIGIVYFGNKIQNLLPRTNNIVVTYMWGIIAISIAVQITTLPITLYNFGYIPTYSILTNIFAIPLAFVLLAGVIVFLLLCTIPIIAELCVITINFFASYLQHIMYIFSHVPHAALYVHISKTDVIMLYILVALSIVYIEWLYKQRIQKQI